MWDRGAPFLPSRTPIPPTTLCRRLLRNFQSGFLRPILSRLDVEVILRSGSPTELLEGLGTLNLDLVLMNRPPPDDSLTLYETHQIGEQAVSIVGTPDRLDLAFLA